MRVVVAEPALDSQLHVADQTVAEAVEEAVPEAVPEAWAMAGQEVGGEVEVLPTMAQTARA